MPVSKPVPHASLSMTGREGWLEWRNTFAEVYDIRSHSEPEGFRAEVDAFDLRDMMVSRLTFGGMEQQGLRTDALRRYSGIDHYGIELCLQSDRYDCEGRYGPVEIHAGSLVVIDLAQSNTLAAHNSDSITLTLPRPLLDAHCPGVDRLHGMRFNAAGSNLLGNHMRSLHRNLHDMSIHQVPALVNATAALAGACLAPSAERVEQARVVIEHTLLDRARHYIDRHLADPSLSPESVHVTIGTSRATLYRLFQPLGGIANYIRDTRLERVRQELKKADGDRSIATLAYQYGFTSAAHFSRAFRRRYGCAPRDIRDPSFHRINTQHNRQSGNRITSWLKDLGAHRLDG